MRRKFQNPFVAPCVARRATSPEGETRECVKPLSPIPTIYTLAVKMPCDCTALNSKIK